MKLENKDRAAKLLKELALLELIGKIRQNYDAEVEVVISSQSNDNTHNYTEVRIPMGAQAREAINEQIKARIVEINRELEEL